MQLRSLGFAACACFVGACGSKHSAAPDAPVDTCGDLMTDVNNCGACGHVCGCGSTSCTAGICDAHVIAPDQGTPVELALHADKLYWGNDGANGPSSANISTAPVSGGSASVLYPGRTAVRGFAFDATRIYFSRFVFNIVESCVLGGSCSGNFTNAQESGAAGIATDVTTVYWATYNTGLLRTSPLGDRGTGSTLVMGETHPDGVALDATSIYWTTNTATGGTVKKVAKTASPPATPVTLADNQANPHRIAVAGGFVYWTDQGDGTPNTGSVHRVSVDGGTITTYADHQPAPYAIAVDDRYVYWTDQSAGTVTRAPLAGGPPVPVVVHEAAPTGLAISSTCLYFTAAGDAQHPGSVRSHDLD
jgi:hypothetical protein